MFAHTRVAATAPQAVDLTGDASAPGLILSRQTYLAKLNRLRGHQAFRFASTCRMTLPVNVERKLKRPVMPTSRPIL
ncbi:hypothetical protein M446_2833 [Methylobacterium sp. 4-46]|nr:hypothetical protein M446_2833 [Methylobacterium sp. 4-46]